MRLVLQNGVFVPPFSFLACMVVLLCCETCFVYGVNSGLLVVADYLKYC